MKRLTYILFLGLAAFALLQGCKKEKIEYSTFEEEITGENGYLCLDSFDLQVANYAEEISSSSRQAETKAGEDAAENDFSETVEAPDDYVIRILNKKTSEEKTFTYAELKQLENQRIPLTPGNYTVSAESADYAPYTSGSHYADWEMPVYYGETDVNIVAKMDSQISELVCRLANVKATAYLTQDLRTLFMSDEECESQGKEKLSVTLSVAGNSLLYGIPEIDSEKAGFFKAVEEDNTIDINLKGQYNKSAADEAPEYIPVDWKASISGCKAGQWRKISIGVTNANDGNIQFQVTVESWAYDEKVNVDIMSMYAYTEETIPDEEVSDKNSPVLSIDGGDISSGYRIENSMFDEVLGKWRENLKLILTPTAGASVKTVEVRVSSDNDDLLAALEEAGYDNGTVSLYPDSGNLGSYIVTGSSSDALSFVLNDAGMTAIYSYKGTHKLKIVATDSENRTSYTDFTIECAAGGSVSAGPEILWKSQDGSKTYDFDKRYNHDEVEIAISVSTNSAFTGFKVEIISDVLTPEALAGVGLSDKLDLLEPGSFEEPLKNLGFPVGDQILSTKNVPFDITSFMELITMLNTNGYCDFKLIVSDESGTTEKTIQLDVKVK